MATVNFQALMRNHINVVGYLNAVAQLLSEFSQAEGPTEVKAEVCREAAQMAEVLETAARLLGHPGVLTLVISRAGQAAEDPAQSEPEISLTTRKVAQA